MARNMLNRMTAYPKTIHSTKPSGKAGSFDNVKSSVSSYAMRPAPASQKHVQTVIKYKQPSKLAQYKQRQVDILVEWHVRLHQELIELKKK